MIGLSRLSRMNKGLFSGLDFFRKAQPLHFNYLNIPKKSYFSYPCPRKLREIVHMSLFEKENAPQIKEIWNKYYDEKPNAMGLHIDSDEMKLIIEK